MWFNVGVGVCFFGVVVVCGYVFGVPLRLLLVVGVSCRVLVARC